MTRDQVVKRYPRLVSHLVCESLGYFTPEAAAGTVASYIRGEPNACEWFSSVAYGMFHNSQKAGVCFCDDHLLEVGEMVLQAAFKNRHYHRGDYLRARSLVERLRKEGDSGAVLMSW